MTAAKVFRQPAVHPLDIPSNMDYRDEAMGGKVWVSAVVSHATPKLDIRIGAAAPASTAPQEYPQPTKEYGYQWEWDPDALDYVRYDQDVRLLYSDYQRARNGPVSPNHSIEMSGPLTRSESEPRSAPTPRVVPPPAPDIPSREQPPGDGDGMPKKASPSSSGGPLDPMVTSLTEFQVVAKPKRFFCVGRIFKTVWFEPADSAPRRGQPNPETWSSKCPDFHGEKPAARLRWFVVVRRRPYHSLCFSITTYAGGKAASRASRGRPPDCAVLHSSNVEPPRPYDEEEITRDPIAVIIEDEEQYISPVARLDCGRIYTVEDSLRVMKIGRVHPASLPLLEQYYKDGVL